MWRVMWRDENKRVHILEGPKESILMARSAIVFHCGNTHVEIRKEGGELAKGKDLY